MKAIKIKVVERGGPRFHCVVAECINEDLALIHIDMHSKRNYVLCESYDERDQCPSIHLSVGEDTLYYNKRLKDKVTQLKFTGFPGWHVVLHESGRYTVTCLLKKESR